MPKNKGKGGNKRRKGKKNTEFDGSKRPLLLKEKDQEYAQVIRMMGNCRLEAKCCDNKTRVCHIRGQMRKRVWIVKDDFILLGLRPYQDSKADIIHKYNPEEVRLLQRKKELPEHFNFQSLNKKEDDDIVFFGNSDDEENSGEQQPELVQNRSYDLPPSFSDDEEEEEETPIRRNNTKKQTLTKNTAFEFDVNEEVDLSLL